MAGIMSMARTCGRSIYKEKIIDIVLGVPVFFLLSRPLLLNMYILGPAYFCVLLSRKWRLGSGILMALLGILRLPNRQLQWKYALIFIFVFLIDRFWRRWIHEKQPVLKSICLAASLPMSVLSLWMLRHIGAYHFVMTVLEAVIFFGCIQVYDRSFRILENHRYNAWKGLAEHRLETACLLGTLLAGISAWEFLNIVPWQIVHLLIISMISQQCGMGDGVIFAALTTVILRITGSCTESYVILSLLLSILSGYFRDMGRLVQGISVISGGILYLILFMMPTRPYAEFLSMVLSQGIFQLIPVGWYPVISEKLIHVEAQPEDSYKEQQIQRLENALLYAADAIGEIPIQRQLTEEDMTHLCSDIAGRLCDKCEKHTLCWGGEFHATYAVIGQVMRATQQKGRICRSDISPEFLEICPRSDEFVRLVNRYFEVYRLNLSWENRLEKNMRLSSMQLRNVAEQIEKLRHSSGLHVDLENQILKQVGNLGYGVSGLWIETEGERIRGIRIRLDQQRSKRATRQLEEVFEKIIGYSMSIFQCHSCGVRVWEWEFREKLRYRVATGVVSNGRETVNGDCYVKDRIGYDQYLLALSDGMGTGSKAHKESELALTFLKKLLVAGCSEEEAINQLNLVLLLHNREESYTTLDLGIIHLGTGMLTLVKAGGTVSLIQRQNQVEMLQAGSVPIGILDEIDPSLYHRQLQNGDVLLMMSDGILDHVPDIRQAEIQIRKALREMDSCTAPQQIAETIYELILETYGELLEDDITILAARILEEP